MGGQSYGYGGYSGYQPMGYGYGGGYTPPSLQNAPQFGGGAMTRQGPPAVVQQPYTMGPGGNASLAQGSPQDTSGFVPKPTSWVPPGPTWWPGQSGYGMPVGNQPGFVKTAPGYGTDWANKPIFNGGLLSGY